MGTAFLQIKFLAVGSYLGHLSIKSFSDQIYRLGPKVRQREGAGGGNHPSPIEQRFTYFSNNEDDIQS